MKSFDSTPGRQERINNEEYKVSIEKIYHNLPEDAVEICGGSSEYYHFTELPLNNTAEEANEFKSALQVMQEIQTIANDTTLPSNERMEKLESGYKQFRSIIYGI